MFRSSLIVVCACALVAASSAMGAATATWNGPNNWDNPDNDSFDIIYNDADNVKFLGSAPTAVTVGAGGVAPGDFEVKGANYTFSGGTITFSAGSSIVNKGFPTSGATFNNDVVLSGPGTVTTDLDRRSITVNGQITGSADLNMTNTNQTFTLTSSGTLTLTGDNSGYTGDITVNQGARLALKHQDALGPGSGHAVKSGAQLLVQTSAGVDLSSVTFEAGSYLALDNDPGAASTPPTAALGDGVTINIARVSVNAVFDLSFAGDATISQNCFNGPFTHGEDWTLTSAGAQTWTITCSDGRGGGLRMNGKIDQGAGQLGLVKLGNDELELNNGANNFSGASPGLEIQRGIVRADALLALTPGVDTPLGTGNILIDPEDGVSASFTGTSNKLPGFPKLVLNGAFIDDGATVTLMSDTWTDSDDGLDKTVYGMIELDFDGQDTIADLILDGQPLGPGTYSAQTHPDWLSGEGALFVPGQTVIPEPATMLALLAASGGLAGYVRRRRAA